MTKEVFTGFFKHAVPVIGGVIGGGLTYMAFGPCCEKLKLSLQNTMLSNPDYDSENDQQAAVVSTIETAETEG